MFSNNPLHCGSKKPKKAEKTLHTDMFHFDLGLYLKKYQDLYF